MNKSKEEMGSPKRSKEWMTTVVKTQQQGIEEAERILEEVLQMGISSVDIEYREGLCYDVEGLMDFYSPGLLRNFRHFFSILYHANNPKMYPEIIAHVNYLLAVLGQAKEYLNLRVEGVGPDTTSTIESHIGYLWRNIDLLEHKLYEENAEIIQLSFDSKMDAERMIFTDKGYWLNLKSGEVQYSCRMRPTRAAKFIKDNDTEFNVLQLDRLFVYPGKMNRRIRWGEAKKREVAPADITAVLGFAKTDYAELVKEIKEKFRDPLVERNPAVLLRLHKTFVNGEHLVLEDEQGGLLTIADLSDDDAPTAELLRAVLPSQPGGCALLAEVNDDTRTDLFSVKPLSIITSDRVIRLLY